MKDEYKSDYKQISAILPNAKNCEELLSKKDVDGGLIGGASLKAPDFAVIVNAATKG